MTTCNTNISLVLVMVFAAVSQLVQGHIYSMIIDAMTSPDIRTWLRTPFSPGSDTNVVKYYAKPTMDITIIEEGPANISWVIADLTLERHSTSSGLSMRPNLFHSRDSDYRATYITIRDRPTYQVVGWRIPFEPVLHLARTDGSVSSMILTPVNMLQVADFQVPVHTWLQTYASDSDAPSTPEDDNQQGDDSPVPSPRGLDEREGGEE